MLKVKFHKMGPLIDLVSAKLEHFLSSFSSLFRWESLTSPFI